MGECRGLNPKPSDPQSDALPIELQSPYNVAHFIGFLSRKIKFLSRNFNEGGARIERAPLVLQTNWPPRPNHPFVAPQEFES